MKGNLKSIIPVKYVLYNRDCIFIYDHHFGNLDDLSLWVLKVLCLIALFTV